jgi:hypothetical protein
MDISRRRMIATIAGLTALGLGAGVAQATPVGFSKPTFVSTTLAGGEPLVFADTKHGTLVYTSHEGTTHLYRNGLATVPINWLAGYRDQVNTWYSKDNGKTWQLSELAGTGTNATGLNARPDQNTGFSDPDLTQDASGRIYNTGINLVSDSLFSTNDGGVTWDKGTTQCHDGDRPWLAAVTGDGAPANDVYLATNTDAGQGTHKIYESKDGGNTCSGLPLASRTPLDSGVADPGGNGKLFWNPVLKELVEPNGGGVAVWKPGDPAFVKGPSVYKGPIFAHWPSIAIDKAGTLYMVWDTSPAGTHNGGQGCPSTLTGGPSDTRTAPPNAIQYAYSKDDGRHWSAPVTVAGPTAGHIEFWPWLTAGDAGRVNIAWYETDRAVDIDCAPVSLSIRDTTIVGADQPAPSVDVADAAGRPVHYGTVCQGGTTCVATGEDRRLGDFFTNAPDANGCVMIASGDTTQWDNTTFTTMPYSLPIIMRQTSGPSLYEGVDCAHPTG